MDTAVAGATARYIGANEGEWVHSAPGVTKKVLLSDERTGELTLLLRFDTGATYPLHNHPGKEEIFVLEGDIKVGKHQMRAGDYLLTPEEGKHAVSTIDGCTVLIKLDKPIEIIEPRH